MTHLGESRSRFRLLIALALCSLADAETERQPVDSETGSIRDFAVVRRIVWCFGIDEQRSADFEREGYQRHALRR